jgi:Family of unknown function (DUF6600)
MRIPANLLIFGIAALLLNLGVPPTQADLEVSASVQIHADADFYAPLSSCGTWVDVGSYGRCWRPAGVVVGWRPYCNGYWMWTDCGWYWASDEPWAWACYHYGYWVYDSTYGWIWVPGIDWAPAWVCWRFGGGYIGWAPMLPPGLFFARHPNDSAFVFVDDDHFNRHITPATLVVNNPGIIRETKFVSGAERTTRDFSGVGRRNVFVNEGPGLAAMEKATGKRFTAIPVRDAARHTPLPSSFRHNPVENRNYHQTHPAVPSKTYGRPAEHYVVPPNPGGPPSGERKYEEVHPAQPPVPAVPRGDRGSSSRPDQGQGGDQGHGHGHD